MNTIGVQTEDELMMGFLLDRKEKFERMKQFFSTFEKFGNPSKTKENSYTLQNTSNKIENISKLNFAQDEGSQSPQLLEKNRTSFRKNIGSQFQDSNSPVDRNKNFSPNEPQKVLKRSTLKINSHVLSTNDPSSQLKIRRSISIDDPSNAKIIKEARNAKLSIISKQEQVSNLSIKNSTLSEENRINQEEQQINLNQYIQKLNANSQRKNSRHFSVSKPMLRSKTRKRSKTPRILGRSHAFFKQYKFSEAISNNQSNNYTNLGLSAKSIDGRRPTISSARKMSQFGNIPIIGSERQEKESKNWDKRASLSPDKPKVRQSKFSLYNVNEGSNSSSSINSRFTKKKITNSNRASIELGKMRNYKIPGIRARQLSRNSFRKNINETIEEQIEPQSGTRKENEKDLKRIFESFKAQGLSPEEQTQKAYKFPTSAKNSFPDEKIETPQNDTRKRISSEIQNLRLSQLRQSPGKLNSPKSTLPNNSEKIQNRRSTAFQKTETEIKQSLTKYKARRSVVTYGGQLNFKNLPNVAEGMSSIPNSQTLSPKKRTNSNGRWKWVNKTIKELKNEKQMFNILKLGQSFESSSNYSDSETGSNLFEGAKGEEKTIRKAP